MKKKPFIIPNTEFTLKIKLHHIIIISVALIALICGGIILGMHLFPKSDIDRDAVEYPWSPPADGAHAGEISIPGYDTLTFPANKKSVDIILPNPSTNPCNFRYRIILKDTDEVLYQSGRIPPGMAVKQITLSRALAVGDYNLEIQIETTSLSDASPMNGAALQVKLKVR